MDIERKIKILNRIGDPLGYNEEKDTYPALYMIIGLPGSGKSYLAEEWSKREDTVLISSDNIREELYGKEEIQGNPKEIFRIMKARTERALKENLSVIYDATNIESQFRTQLLESLIEIKCQKIAVVMLTPYEECVERDSKRERSVGEKVILKYFTKFSFPWWHEGWDKIEIVYDDKNFISKSEMLSDLMDINFTDKVSYGKLSFNIAKNKNISNRSVTREAGLLCYIGKKFAKEHHMNALYNVRSISAYLSMMTSPLRESMEDRLLRAILIQNQTGIGHASPIYSIYSNECEQAYFNAINVYIENLRVAITTEEILAEYNNPEATY